MSKEKENQVRAMLFLINELNVPALTTGAVLKEIKYELKHKEWPQIIKSIKYQMEKLRSLE